jgi:hypothetical protein
MLAWWQAVKWFDCGGYALAGSAGAKGGIANVLRILLTMRDDGAFESGRDWIHVLGVSTPKWAILLSAIQRALRKSVNPRMRISYDSATPFQRGAILEDVAIMPTYTSRPRDWAIRFDRVEQSATLVGSNEPFPYASPIGNRLTMGDLNVNGGDWSHRNFDTISNLLLCNHNCWVLIDAFRQANELAFETDRTAVPAQWRECLAFIGDVFEADDWVGQLAQKMTVIHTMAPNEFNA